MSSPDYFAAVRPELITRRDHLLQKYPDMETDRIGTLGRAGDVLFLARQALLDAADQTHLAMIEDAVDLRLLAAIASVDRNEEGAGLELHRFIAAMLRENTTTPALREVLATMHEAISRGASPTVAMMLDLPAGKPSKAERDEQVRRFVALGLHPMFGTTPPAGEVYAGAADVFGLKVKTIRNICSRVP